LVVTDRTMVCPASLSATCTSSRVTNFRVAMATSLEMIWDTAARSAAMIPPAAAVEAPKVMKAMITLMNSAATATQNATLIEIFEYWVSRAKLSVC
jgi:hypothetical protein